MTALSLTTFALAMALLAATPGPGVFATVARALASGFRQAASVGLGIVTGDLVFLLFAVYGLAAVAQWLGDFFTPVKYVGAVYLVWLGIGLWRTPVGRAVVARHPTSCQTASPSLMACASEWVRGGWLRSTKPALCRLTMALCRLVRTAELTELR